MNTSKPQLIGEAGRLFHGQICREVPGFPGYWVPQSGEFVISTKRGPGRKMALFPDRGGYKIVSWRTKTAKKLPLHHAVLFAWIGPRTAPLTRHLDDDKNNNSATNLAWGTDKENGADKRKFGTSKGEKNPRCRLKEADVIYLREQAKTRSVSDLMREFPQVSQSALLLAIKGRNWKHLPGAVASVPRIYVNTAPQDSKGRFTFKQRTG